MYLSTHSLYLLVPSTLLKTLDLDTVLNYTHRKSQLLHFCGLHLKIGSNLENIVLTGILLGPLKSG